MRTMVALFAVFLGLTAPCAAQPPSAAQELLHLVPDDMALCVVMRDLRGHLDQVQKSTWYRAFKESALGKTLLASGEFKKFVKLERDLRDQFGVDWPGLRDDIFGDAVVFAFRHGGKADDEHGLFLVKAGDAKLLANLIDRINDHQLKSGELKALEKVRHNGAGYFRRVEKSGQHFYALDGPLLMLTGKEEVLHKSLALRVKQGKPAPVLAQIQRARAADAFVTLWLNPRAVDAELQQRLKEADDFEKHGLKEFVKLWQALEAVVVSFTPGEELELVVSVQAKAEISPAFERLFNHIATSSELWDRFPDKALFAMAGHVDIPGLVESVKSFTPPELREVIGDSVQKGIEAALGIDLLADVLPNMGPDWGLSISAAAQPQDFPHVIAALAVRSGGKNVDQVLLRALHGAALYAAVSYGAPLKRLPEGQADGYYLAHDGFPRGLQPAFALKDGYLLLASSPEAIRQFRKGAGKIPPAGEALSMRISLTEVSKLIKQHREKIEAFLADKNKIRAAEAATIVQGVLDVLAPFERLTLSERTGQGQISMILRLTAAK